MVFSRLYLHELLLILVLKCISDDEWDIILITSCFSSYILIANKHELFTYLPQNIWESQDFERFAFLQRAERKPITKGTYCLLLPGNGLTS